MYTREQDYAIRAYFSIMDATTHYEFLGAEQRKFVREKLKNAGYSPKVLLGIMTLLNVIEEDERENP